MRGKSQFQIIMVCPCFKLLEPTPLYYGCSILLCNKIRNRASFPYIYSLLPKKLMFCGFEKWLAYRKVSKRKQWTPPTPHLVLPAINVLCCITAFRLTHISPLPTPLRMICRHYDPIPLNTSPSSPKGKINVPLFRTLLPHLKEHNIKYSPHEISLMVSKLYLIFF